MAVRRLLPDGQLVLPDDIREAAGLRPGDAVSLQVLGQGIVQIRALPRLTLDEALARYRIEGTPDESIDRESWQSSAVRDVIEGPRAWQV